jgi:hypothetical protein
MKIKHRNSKLSQSTLAYIIFIIILIGAFSAMVPKVRQRFQASYKESADTFGEGRQFGSLSTSAGVAPFEFPVLPGSEPVDPPEPPPVDNPNCDPAYLSSLSQDAMNKQQIFSDLSQEAGEANLAAVEAEEAEETAEVAAQVARDEAVLARQEATDARQAANAKESECNDCRYGEGGFWGDCETICDEAESLAEEATRKEGIATDKERIAVEKEEDYQAKRAEARRLEQESIAKTQIAAQAGEEATAAAEALQQANTACFSSQ